MCARRILVIEDEPDTARLLATCLEETAAMVDIASDGIAGCHRATVEPYDLILLHLMLPGASGLQVCSSIRAQQNYTPIIILTARSSEAEKIAALDAGADDYMTKPFSVEELLSRARALWRRVQTWSAAAEAVPELSVGPLAIDVAKRCVYRDGTIIELTAKEFDLLLLLARAPGRVYSRAELLRDVWGYGHDGYRHTVDAHVSRLRGKVEIDRANPSLIRTVWGVGYRLDASPLSDE